jgi:hypothetical protein
LSHDDKMLWHIYAYAFDKYYGLNSGSTALDRDGRWYSERLVQLAFDALYPKKRKPDKILPADQYARKGDYEMAEHCRKQDRERAAAAHFSEAEYVALCLRQVGHNRLIFEERSKRR